MTRRERGVKNRKNDDVILECCLATPQQQICWWCSCVVPRHTNACTGRYFGVLGWQVSNCRFFNRFLQHPKNFVVQSSLWPFSTIGMRLLLAISRWTAEIMRRTQKIEKMHVRHERLWECGTSTKQIRSSNLYHLLRNRSAIDCVFCWIFKKNCLGSYYGRTLSLIPAVYGTSARFKSAIKTFFDSLPLSFFVTFFSKTVKRWKYVADFAGDYCPNKL